MAITWFCGYIKHKEHIEYSNFIPNVSNDYELDDIYEQL